jgi:aryl-alcohol dehydrogenase-like predicted oxidoreductase
VNPPALEIPTVALPQDGPSLPRIALGCGSFGGVGSAPEFFGQGLDDEGAAAVMDAAWEMGITHFDTADAYGGGRSEAAIGRWISARGVRPTLTTKTFNPMGDGEDAGLSVARITRQFESSLERLGVDAVELYLAHEVDPTVPWEESFGAFASLRASGQLRAYGVSNVSADALRDALTAGAPSVVQNGYSLLDRGDEVVEEGRPVATIDQPGVLELCAQRGVAYTVYSPLAGGWLTGKYRRGAGYPDGSRMTQRPEPYTALAGSDRTFDALEALEAFATQRGQTMAAVALAWLLGDPRIAQVVVGPARPSHLEPVREALDAPLSPEERDQVSEMFA